MGDKNKLILENVWKHYRKVEAIKGLNLKCREGEFFSILGPSGAGKTSLLRMIAGVEPVTSGHIYINRVMINDIPPEHRNVAMFFENYALYPHLTVFENIASPLRAPLRAEKYTEKEIDKKVREIAELLGIENFLQRKPAHLSGGQKQRVALGRTLVRRPSILLLDEPISHLDAKLRHRMRGELKRICEALKVTVIYATPDYKEAMAMADRIAVINQGILQQIGTPDEIFNHPANEFVADFVGEPPMNFVDGEIREKDRKMLLRSKGIEIILPEDISRLISKERIKGKIKLGIRPMYVKVAKEPSADFYLPAEVYTIEPLGYVSILTGKVGEDLIQAFVSSEFKIEIGKKIWLRFEAERLIFFK